MLREFDFVKPWANANSYKIFLKDLCHNLEGVYNLFFCYSFQPTVDGSENDMRFIYCACCISYILNDWSGIDVPKVVQYIKKSRVIDYFVTCFSHL